MNNCFFPSRLKAPNKHECLCELVTVTIGLLFLLIHTFLIRESKKKKNDSSNDTAVVNPCGKLFRIF